MSVEAQVRIRLYNGEPSSSVITGPSSSDQPSLRVMCAS